MDLVKNIEAKEAFKILEKEDNSYLIDVRTLPEWSFIGFPDLSKFEKEVIKISWKIFPQMNINKNFQEQIESEFLDKNSKLFFLCKVGGRSLDAANFCSQLGYRNCYNILNGFEGDLDENSHRGNINGWKAAKLPWLQS